MERWRSPRTWARAGRWLLLPIAVLDWVALAPQPVVVIAFLVAVVGFAGMAAALVVRMLHRSRAAMAGLGVVLLLGGLVVLGLDPFPGTVPTLDLWWPDAITQPQVVGSAYWKTAGLGVELAGFALLGTLLVVTLTGGPDRARRSTVR
ncbi:hypothetical protein QP735_11690 [Curtobacterium citreum]|uniref:hypothetical protein n=1 Tax=Curtobacterium citreum TaxID=2036 RepID=UPI00254FC51E|nr:hypothetical protein [Curtobacterium citreum]MDK8173190.1 hypothetical protein [Curtobacterium citreum]